VSLWNKILIGVFATFFVIILALVYLIVNVDSGACINHLHQQLLSPGKQLKAVVFERSCGEAQHLSTQVAIIGAAEDMPAQGGNLLVIDGAAAKFAPKLYWVDDENLWIYRQLDGTEVLAEQNWHGMKQVTVTYLAPKSP